MNNLFSKSPETFEKLIQSLLDKFEILQKNVNYITYRCDTILKILRTADTDKSLQEQVDKYFDSDNGDTADSQDSI